MKCSKCGATGPCWYNAARRLVCKACRDVEQNEKRDTEMTAKYVGKIAIWLKSVNLSTEYVPVTIVSLKVGKIAWLIVRDGDGIEHRVKPHNVTVAA